MQPFHVGRVTSALMGATLGFSTLTGARAQTPAQPRDPNMPDPNRTIPEKIEPQQDPRSTGSGARPGESLSDRLDRTDGVIRPPENLSPDMSVRPPVPDPGTTLVIPPPGSPGGNQNIKPK